MTLEQVTKELDIHFSRIDAVLAELKSYLPLKVSDFQEIEKIKTIDFFYLPFYKDTRQNG